MEFVFGPVPSRRLGQSLGIDPIPFKTCNWNCVYCQLGRTTPMTNQRCDYFPPDEIVAQIKAALESHRRGEIDWVTFTGSGEPTLHASLGWMIRQVKALTDIPVAVLTNGSLLYLLDVRDELLAADAVLPSLDAGTESLYRTINRPWAELTYDRLVDGLIAFRHAYTGKLWIEVMLLKGLNDSEEALTDIAAILRRIGPDEVHVNLPIRPPAELWVEPSDEEGLMRATAILGEVAHIIHPVEGTFDLSGYESVVEALVGVITRHPMREEELIRTLDRWTPDQVAEALAELDASGRVKVVVRYDQRFWSSVGARYADEAHSKHPEQLRKACK